MSFMKRAGLLTIGYILLSACGVYANGQWACRGPYGAGIASVAFDPTNPQIIYVGTGAGINGMGGDQFGARVFKSVDGGQTWSAGNGKPFGSVVDAIAIDPITPKVLYAGTNGGGIFRSADGGASWKVVSRLPVAQTWSLAVDPTRPTTLYAGTPLGVYKSVDSGLHWKPIDNGLPGSGVPTPEVTVESVVVDPALPSILYAVLTYKGIYKSVNGGVSWISANSKLFGNEVHSLVLDPKHHETLYAGSDNGIFKSIDGGRHWTPANSGLPTRSPAIMAVTVASASPSRVYALEEGGNIFRSTDGAAHWTKVTPTLTDTQSNYVLAVSPASADTVFAGSDAGLFSTADAGRTWTRTEQGITGLPVLVVADSPSVPHRVYAATTGRGVFESDDDGTSWRPKNDGLPPRRLDVTGLAVNSAPHNAIYVWVDGGRSAGLYKSVDGGTTWQYVNSGIDRQQYVSAIAIDPSMPSVIYVGTGMPSNEAIFKSVDGGRTWAPASYGLSTRMVSALEVTRSSPPIEYAATMRGGVFSSSNGGISWIARNNGLTDLSVFALAIDPKTPSTVYAGTNHGVFVTFDSALSWTPIDQGISGRALHVRTLAIDPGFPSVIYSGTWGGGLQRSLDGGLSWESIGDDLPSPFIQSITISPGTRELYVGMLGGSVCENDLTNKPLATSLSRRDVRSTKAIDRNHRNDSGTTRPR